MTGSTRIKGAALGLTIAGVDYWADISSAVFGNEEATGGVTTFADAAAGGSRQHFVTLSAIQSLASASFWRYVWANTGATATYKYAAHGNASATANEPHLTGSLKIGPKPSLGGEAGNDNTYTFETRFDISGEPVLDVGASGGPVITAVAPTGRGIGELVVIGGTRFTGVTGVTFEGVAVEFVFNSDSSISAVVAGVGAADVIVTTPSGASPAVEYTVVA